VPETEFTTVERKLALIPIRLDNKAEELIQKLRPLGQAGSSHSKSIVSMVVHHSLVA
jgi:hypothetical protein